MKRYLRALLSAVSVILLLVLFLASLSSCGEQEKVDLMSLPDEEFYGYVELGAYKELSISLDQRTKEDAVWESVIENTKIFGYPKEYVGYYEEQIKSQYKHYAKEAGMSYRKMLEQLGESRESIALQAKKMYEKDIVYSAIVKKESISLSENEKDKFFDRYVEKYADIYSRDAEYVKDNMADEIYAAMLYDKTTEFLIVNNFITE